MLSGEDALVTQPAQRPRPLTLTRPGTLVCSAPEVPLPEWAASRPAAHGSIYRRVTFAYPEVGATSPVNGACSAARTNRTCIRRVSGIRYDTHQDFTKEHHVH